jgi:hypothetical protein
VKRVRFRARLSPLVRFRTRSTTRINMHFRTFAVLLYVTPVSLAAAAPPNPAQPDAPVPVVKHESGLAGYVPFREEKLASWREVNDEVARAGGHVGIFGGAHGGHAAGTATKPPAASPAQK